MADSNRFHREFNRNFRDGAVAIPPAEFRPYLAPRFFRTIGRLTDLHCATAHDKFVSIVQDRLCNTGPCSDACPISQLFAECHCDCFNRFGVFPVLFRNGC